MAFVIIGLACLVAAALVVPLPRVVREPGAMVPVGDRAGVFITGEVASGSGPSTPINGTYLTTAGDANPSLVEVAVAYLRPDQDVRRRQPLLPIPQFQPANMAALVGLGLSPARMQGAELPVRVTVDPELDASSLGVALQLFDEAAQQDAAAGRTVAGIGTVLPNDRLRCDGPAAATVAAAEHAGADLVVVASACGNMPPSSVEILQARTFRDAAAALVGRSGN